MFTTVGASGRTTTKTKETVNNQIGTPVNDFVLLRRIDERTSIQYSHIVIPEAAKEKSQEGEVLAVGPGKPRDFILPRRSGPTARGISFALSEQLESDRMRPMVKVGDRVMFGKYAGYDIEIDGQPLTMVREHEIFFIFNTK